MHKEAEIVERHLRPDHVHMCLRVPPKYAASNVVGYLKGKSMIMIARFFIREGTVLKHQDSHSAGGGQGVLPVSLPKHDTWRGSAARSKLKKRVAEAAAFRFVKRRRNPFATIRREFAAVVLT